MSVCILACQASGLSSCILACQADGLSGRTLACQAGGLSARILACQTSGLSSCILACQTGGLSGCTLACQTDGSSICTLACKSGGLSTCTLACQTTGLSAWTSRGTLQCCDLSRRLVLLIVSVIFILYPRAPAFEFAFAHKPTLYLTQDEAKLGSPIYRKYSVEHLECIKWYNMNGIFHNGTFHNKFEKFFIGSRCRKWICKM